MTEEPDSKPVSDLAFSDSVKAVQAARGSRAMFERKDEEGGWRTAISPDLAQFIGEITTAYLATVSADGQPYVQHRGGPPGFLRVLDEHTIAFVDFKGNRQYITTGNLADNERVHLFLIDYQNQRRVKLWGRARIVEGDAELIQRLFPSGYRARAEQVMLIRVDTWDINCSQHIPQMFHAADVAETIKTFQARVRELDDENARLKARIADLESAADSR
jgi:uncharacterized protein